MCVKWKSVKINFFTVMNGVKQGAIMSPTLFAVYFDKLLAKYRKENVGCRILHIFLGAFSYAEDIILLAPTTTALGIFL